MKLENYILQVLIEENPWTNCKDVKIRQIVYSDVAYLIALDLYTETDKREIITQHLEREFGNDVRNIDRIFNRICPAFVSDDLKEEFNNG